MIRACRVTRGWPYPPILLLDEIHVAKTLFATVTPFISDPFVQTFSESFRQPIGEGLCHDCVVVVMLRPELVAKLLQPDSAGHRKTTNMVRQPCLLWCNEVG